MKKIKHNKFICVFLCMLLAMTSVNISAVNSQAADSIYVASKDNHTRKTNAITTNVTSDMCFASFWYDKSDVNQDQVLATKEEIRQINKSIVDGSGTYVRDMLTQVKDTFNADTTRTSLASQSIPTRELYKRSSVNDSYTKITDNNEYFGNINTAILNTGYTGTNVSTVYGIACSRVNIKSWPTNDLIGYSDHDTDDEFQSAILNVNEPFAIRGICQYDGETFYYGYSNNCSGWVSGENIALCDDKDSWASFWKIDVSDEDIMVVTDSQVNLSNGTESVPLMLGTVLKMVPDSELPSELVSEKDSNYFVYFPTKDSDGKAVNKIAKIPKSMESESLVSKGFLSYTPKNVLNVAFSCYGDTYGWGGMDNKMDCSSYTRYIYRCFGFELPRNTTWQMKVPNYTTDLTSYSDESKSELFDGLSAGALLYFKGHAMMYIGKYNNKYYVISDLGTVYDEDGSDLISAYAVTVNTLNVKRGNGNTWLTNLNGLLDLALHKTKQTDDDSSPDDSDGGSSYDYPDKDPSEPIVTTPMDDGTKGDTSFVAPDTGDDDIISGIIWSLEKIYVEVKRQFIV